MREHVITSLGRRLATDVRGALAGLAAGAWLLAALGLMVWLGREQALAARDGWSETSRALASAPGWVMRHVLPADPRIASAIAEHLSSRGRIRGLDEEIVAITSALPAALADRLRASGWACTVATTAVSEGYLEIRAPGGAEVWRGAYQNSDFLFGAPMLRDDLALAALLEGERLPAVVPSGCSATAFPLKSSLNP